MSAPDASPDIGRYELLSRLAVGGMAEIFLAVERGMGGLERHVVIKRILPQLAEDPSFVEMFLREARIIARLNHPNVVHIHELGQTSEGDHYIAMEYINGATARELQLLAEKVGRNMPVGVAAGIVSQTARGLHAAHELSDAAGAALGLVHRDISPHNLMVTSEGHVKLLDFGIAKATQGADATFSGSLKGKFSYMSPEQCNKQRLDRRSDIFALGIVLWELLTGRRLFKRESELDMVEAIRTEEVPPPSAFAEVPRWVDEVVMQSLAKDRNRRFESADTMRRAVERAADEAQESFGPDAIAQFVTQVAGDTLEQRRTTLRQARERTLISVERRQLLHRTDTDSLEADDDSATNVERPGPEHKTVSRPRRLWLHPALWAAVAGVALIGALWGVLSGGGRADRTVPQNVRPPLAGEPVLFGWPPYVDPDQLLDELEPFQHYLEDSLQRPVSFIVTESYADCAARLSSGELAFAALPPLLYVLTTDAEPDVQLLALKEYDGSESYSGWLMVPDSSDAVTLADLNGRRFCFTDEHSTSGYFLPRHYIRSQGFDPASFIGDIHWSGQHSQALRDVLDGFCDVVATYNGAVFSADEDGLATGRLRLLAITGQIPQDVVVAAPDAESILVERMRQALLAFDPQATAGQTRIGAVQRLTGFVPATDELFGELRQAVADEGL